MDKKDRLAQPEQEPPCKTGSQCIGGKCERCAVPEGCAECGKQASDGWALYCVKCSEVAACIVKGCRNHKHEGHFVGDLCGPCHTFITTGEGKYSQAYRNAQREWQGLTDEEILTLKKKVEESPINAIMDIEAALKAKNA